LVPKARHCGFTNDHGSVTALVAGRPGLATNVTANRHNT
jgi:hypothetical protein